MKTHHKPTPRFTPLSPLGFGILGFVISLGFGIWNLGFASEARPDLYGTLHDTTGAPVPNVTVSDGYQCTTTDAQGRYQMTRHPKARMVYYSTPENYAITTAAKPGKTGGPALFYQPLAKRTQRYDFTLTPLPAPEKIFTLICIGDPQVKNETQYKRYQSETIADLYKFTKTIRVPCYAILLGDICFDTLNILAPMRDATARAEIPFFAVIGNHDHDKKIRDDYRSGEYFETIFGPLNYSFNRPGVHIIGMDNVLYGGRDDKHGGFTDEQVAWLRQDLATVPKDKIIVLAYHIPLRERGSRNRDAILNLFKGYSAVHLMAGHTHTNENVNINNPIRAYEHIHGTACGSWWHSFLNTDGAPNGYAAYTFANNKLVDWFYKATGYGRDYQLRMHRGDARFGSPTGGYFTYGQTARDIVVNVWNADNKWKIVAYENDIEIAPLKKLPTMADAYTVGIHAGLQGRKEGSDNANTHLYKHTLRDPKAKLEIRATDRFGKTYTLTEITNDLAAAKKLLKQ